MDPAYRDTGALHLPGLLPTELLDVCRARLAGAAWVPDAVTGDAFAFDTAEVDLPELAAFLDGPAAIRARCGLPAGTRFAGQLKRLASGSEHRFPWHRDHRHGRRVGMSVNLSPGPVEGGLFEQRLRWETEPAVRIDSQPGDVHLFDVSDPRWVHRVTPVTAGARVVLAGWWR